ncbi:MAG: hypothetical protein GC199_03475 [Alphaproteobacteria bacterium]|nr:hypothetical protein [Alphaproteobacteria bacterium]
MPQLAYSRDELMAEDTYASPHSEAGYRLHGGFDAQGRYVSPRTKLRWPAVKAWQAALTAQGYPLIDASVQLLRRGNYPTIEQQKMLLDAGLGETLWNGLTITGVIEARGRALCDVTAPDFQAIVAEDISETCTGHLNKGLLFAHGLDEGGDPASGVGAHDQMWFAVRDLLFGKDAYPMPVVPESLSRPEAGRRMPGLPIAHEQWILLLMNVLMIEVRAESYFSFCTNLMRSPDTFRDRREAAMHAAELVDRIRTDEAIHVAYLQTFLSEMRRFTLKLEDGRTVPGSSLIDPVWDGMIEWHTVTNAEFGREQTRNDILARIDRQPRAAELRSHYLSFEQKAAAE